MKLKLLIPLLLLAPLTLMAQQSAAPAAYRIQVILHETQSGKAETVHTFVLNATPDATVDLQAGDKIPVATSTAAGATQFTYDPVGINIRCTLPASHEIPSGAVRFRLNVQVSAVVASPSGSMVKEPVFRYAQADVSTVVPLGKATAVADFSDIGHVARYQVQVLATPLP